MNEQTLFSECRRSAIHFQQIHLDLQPSKPRITRRRASSEQTWTVQDFLPTSPELHCSLYLYNILHYQATGTSILSPFFQSSISFCLKYEREMSVSQQMSIVISKLSSLNISNIWAIFQRIQNDLFDCALLQRNVYPQNNYQTTNWIMKLTFCSYEGAAVVDVYIQIYSTYFSKLLEYYRSTISLLGNHRQ